MHKLFWANTILKTINISFTPLSEMTPEAWAILDYGSLRPVAMNRIAEMAVAGRLIGFYDVKVLSKARAKGNYFQPVDEGVLTAYGETGDPGAFVNEADGDIVESEDALKIDSIASSVSILGIAGVSLFIGLLIKFMGGRRDELTPVESNSDTQEAVSELEEAIKNLKVIKKNQENFKSPYDLGIAATIIALWAIVLDDIQTVQHAADELDI